MKKILYFAAVLASAATILPGCSGFLDEATNGKVFSNALETQAGLEAALTGTYKQWSNPWDNGFQHTWFLELTMGGEDMGTSYSAANTVELDTYNVTSSNSSVPNIYKSCYRSIKNANSVIEAAENCTGDKAVIDQILGEALFIRAYDYFWLGRMHKAIPLMTSSAYNEEDLNVQMTGTDGIFALIESDLTQAISLLPNSRRNGENARPNKGTAKALLAEVYLQMAGWPLNKAGYYQKAADMAKDVLDNKATYGFDFENDYETLYLKTPETAGITKENIFSMCSNNANWCYGTASGPAQASGWDYIYSEINFFKNFPEGVRKDYTFMTKIACNDGTVKDWTELAPVPKPVYRKLAVNDEYKAGGWSIAICMLRLSQTALTFAEASARATNSVSADAAAYLNQIRTRAGLAPVTTTNAAEFATAVVNERMWELAAEGVRWWDVQRLQLLDQAIAQRDPAENPINGSKGEANYFFPLPNSEQVLNPNINK